MSPPEEEVKARMSDGTIIIQKPIEQPTPSFYINNAVFSSTPWDIRLDLSEMKTLTRADDEEEGPQTVVAHVIRRATIVITPAYARSFVEALTAQIEKHAKFGEVDEDDQESEPSTE